MIERVTYTIPEVAKLLGINRASAYELAKHSKENGFPAIWVSPRRVVVPCSALERWLEEFAFANSSGGANDQH